MSATLGGYMLFSLKDGGAPLPVLIGMFRAGAEAGLNKMTLAFTAECLGRKIDIHLLCTAPEPVGKTVLVSIAATLEGVQTEASQATKEVITTWLKGLFFGASIIDGLDGLPQVKIPF